MKIIPAIDIIEGKCVRLSQGDYATQKIYNEDPLEVAKEFEDNGFTYLHLVDLDGAKAGKIVNSKTLENIASKTNLKIDFGGGIKSDNDVRIAFDSGANQITGGSIAIKNPELFLSWLNEYGADKIMLGADCLDKKIAVQGWTENTNQNVISFISEFEKKGITKVVCTDISKDGMLQGPSFELYNEIIQKTKVELIASGGISSIQDIEKLTELNVDGVIIGKAIYEGRIKLKELRDSM